MQVILSIHGPSCLWTILSVLAHGPPSSYIHWPFTLYIDFLLFFGIYISIHDNTLCSGNLCSIYAPATLCVDHSIYTQTILSTHISYPVYIIIFVLGPSIYMDVFSIESFLFIQAPFSHYMDHSLHLWIISALDGDHHLNTWTILFICISLICEGTMSAILYE